MGARIVLLQDAVYFPSFGGGNKANRLLLTELAARGFECLAVSRIPGANRVLASRFSASALAERGIVVETGEGGLSYRHEGVRVEALDLEDPQTAGRIERLLKTVEPDWILVSDDRPAMLLDIALRQGADRVVALVHTHFHLPFGPEAERHDAVQHERLRRARGIVAVSEHSRAYLRAFGELDSVRLHFPVFGDGPFESPADPEAGYVTMINPCLVKGLPVFLALAARFPDTRFAAVPTWGGDAGVREQLQRLPNMKVFEPAEDIGAILRHARILVAPSLVPETFGYVILDAMLRGIPVLAGNLGGQPEAKLGVDFTLPLVPATRTAHGHVAPRQDLGAWQEALHKLLSDPAAYRRCATESRVAASAFLPQTDAGHFVRYLASL